MPTLLITGAGRGLGLEFVRQYAAEGWRVIGTVRKPAAAAELQQIGAQAELLDMRDFDALERFATAVAEPIDLFIANAGASGPHRVASVADAQLWRELHGVNTIAPALLAGALLPRVAEARGKLIAISSTLSSISQSGGGFLTYRSVKAGLNSAWKTLSRDHARQPVTFALLHPGWARTDMGGPSATVPVADSVRGMRSVIAGLDSSRSGGFFDYQGKPIPW